MATHFKLKGIQSGEEVVGNSLSLTGNSEFKVFPMSKNIGTTPIRESAYVRILGKVFPIVLNHEGSNVVDPEPSSVKWSYFTEIYSDGDTLISGDLLKNQDYGFVMASPGKVTSNQTPYFNKSIMISKLFNTQQALLNKVGDFSDPTSGTEYVQSQSQMVLCNFVMFYKNIPGSNIVPTDDDTNESNKERIPCKPEISSYPDWIVSPKLSYILNTVKNGVSTSRSYTDWDEFISDWEDIHDNIVEYYDVVFNYQLSCTVITNSSLHRRGPNIINITEISNHGAKPLSLEISQQPGFIKYHLGCIDTPSTAWREVTSGNDVISNWSIDSLPVYQLASNKLPEYQGNVQGDPLNGACYFRPEFKVRNSTDIRAPFDMYGGHSEGDTIISSLTPKSEGFVYKYQYIGKPITFGLYKETPEIFDSVGFKPYYKGDDRNNPDIWLTENSRSLLGAQMLDPHKLDKRVWTSNTILVYSLNFKDNQPYFRESMENRFHFAFKLIPLSLLGYDNLTYRPYAKGVNEVEYFNNGNSAVTENELVTRALFYNYLNTNPNNTSVGTFSAREWEVEHNDPLLNPIKYKNLRGMIFLPVLFTNFRVEDYNPFTENGEIGRLWFSPNDITDNSQNEFVLRQLIIQHPLITKV